MPYGQTGEPPLWAPYYGAPFPAAIKRFWQKYTAFSGRASRSEYWWWVLVAAVVSFILQIIVSAGTAGASAGTASATMGAGLVIGGILSLIWGLATIVPSLALMARRLHDVNMSAWLILIVLVPFLGALALLVLTVLPSNPAGQRFDQPAGI
jgi:uncharacterized membrane protein YhaH (DUF805 family)